MSDARRVNNDLFTLHHLLLAIVVALELYSLQLTDTEPELASGFVDAI